MGKLRVKENDRQKLRDLAEEDWVRENADPDLSPETSLYSYVLSAIVPNEVDEEDVLSREMVYVHGVSDDIKSRVDSMAGENVPVHEVLELLIQDAKEDMAGQRIES